MASAGDIERFGRGKYGLKAESVSQVSQTHSKRDETDTVPNDVPSHQACPGHGFTRNWDRWDNWDITLTFRRFLYVVASYP